MPDRGAHPSCRPGPGVQRRPWSSTLALALVAALVPAPVTAPVIAHAAAAASPAAAVPPAVAAGSDLAGSDLAGSDPAGSDPAGSDPAGSDPAGSDVDAAELDAVARVLAGLPVATTHPWSPSASSRAVVAHGKAIEAAWARHTASTYAALQVFATAELQDAGEGPVFYPFGGPDILNAVALFPAATSYTLLGLEPVGPLPTSALFAEPRVLPGVQRALSFVLRHNHFITDAMTEQLKGRVGVAALLAFFLVRTGHTIVDARFVTLDAAGAVVAARCAPEPRAAAGCAAPTKDADKDGLRGVEFTVRRGDRPQVQHVRYFAGNINDEFFSRARGLVPHLLAQGRLTTVLKAASYLMYYPAFDDIRSLVLARSGLLVTDTSGLPFHRLDTPQWRLTLFGGYLAPIAAYADRCQPELQAALRQRGRGRLPFPYGYSYGAHNHLIVARRAADGALQDPVFDGTKYRGEHTWCADGRVRIEHPG